MMFKDLELHSNILKAIDACGFEQPTQIQSQAIPTILSGVDLVASAQTGTGKTAAYVLPALQRLAERKSTKNPKVLILAPTRELSTQITKVINDFSRFINVKVASIIGGVPYAKQIKQLSRNLDILIATPGRLLDHVGRGRIDLSEVEMFILDEADHMLDMGFMEPIQKIAKLVTGEHQTLMFSATVEKKLMSLAKNLLKDPAQINVSAEKTDIKKIKQTIHFMSDRSDKKKFLATLLRSDDINKAIIFSGTKHNARKLRDQINESGYRVGEIHGDLRQSARNRNLTEFREGKTKFLVATDVASRGIDVSDITHVINYDIPKFSEDYVHRIGRTGRAGRTGVAISIALHSEKRTLDKIERFIGQKIERIGEVIEDVKSRKGTAHKKKRSGSSSSRGGFRGTKGSSEGFSRKERGGRFGKDDSKKEKSGSGKVWKKKTNSNTSRPNTKGSTSSNGKSKIKRAFAKVFR